METFAVSYGYIIVNFEYCIEIVNQRKFNYESKLNEFNWPRVIHDVTALRAYSQNRSSNVSCIYISFKHGSKNITCTTFREFSDICVSYNEFTYVHVTLRELLSKSTLILQSHIHHYYYVLMLLWLKLTRIDNTYFTNTNIMPAVKI